jgi:hypothetical protein
MTADELVKEFYLLIDPEDDPDVYAQGFMYRLGYQDGAHNKSYDSDRPPQSEYGLGYADGKGDRELFVDKQ